MNIHILCSHKQKYLFCEHSCSIICCFLSGTCCVDFFTYLYPSSSSSHSSSSSILLQVRCLKSPCFIGTYQSFLNISLKSIQYNSILYPNPLPLLLLLPVGTELCLPCHKLCVDCALFGITTVECFKCSLARSNGICVDSCDFSIGQCSLSFSHSLSLSLSLFPSFPLLLYCPLSYASFFFNSSFLLSFRL